MKELVHDMRTILLITLLLIVQLVSAWRQTPAAVGGGTLPTFLPIATLPEPPNTTTRASIYSDGTQSPSSSYDPSISGDGRYVTFASYDSEFVEGGAGEHPSGLVRDIYVHDRMTGENELITIAYDGARADDDSDVSAISRDGRFVAFTSTANNLVEVDFEIQRSQVFVRDRMTMSTTFVSLSYTGGDPDWYSYGPSISDDGRFISYTSRAANLIPDDNNYEHDVFVFDQHTGVNTRVSVASDGTEANGETISRGISGDGRYVVMATEASNLLGEGVSSARQLLLHDRATGETSLAITLPDGQPWPCSYDFYRMVSISGDGRYIAFSSSAVAQAECHLVFVNVFVHDRLTKETTRVSISSDGSIGGGREAIEPSISSDGRYVAFRSDGRFVLEDINGEQDIYLHDRVTGETWLASIATDGWISDARSSGPKISADGYHVVFYSDATTLVNDDTNDRTDVFVHYQRR